uniref:Ovule protein n=1 Tax=Steinernema glaseri TaxID=37863 RepID=A0A1I8A012_9BILA
MRHDYGSASPARYSPSVVATATYDRSEGVSERKRKSINGRHFIKSSHATAKSHEFIIVQEFNNTPTFLCILYKQTELDQFL